MFEPLLITASAGSGKTYQLTNRYIALLLAGENPSRILATTFTRKAAGEIRERIFTRLADAILDSGNLGLLAEGLVGNKVPVSRVAVARSFESLLRENHRLSIGTLDSLFFKLAQSFSYELGQNPGWTLGETVQLKKAEREALQVMCAKAEPRKLHTLVQLMHRGELKRSVHEELEARVQSLYDVYRETDPGAWDWMSVPPLVTVDELKRAVEALRCIELPTTKKGEPDKNWVAMLQRILTHVEGGRWKELLEETLVAAILEGDGTYRGRPAPENLRNAIGPFIRQARAVVLRMVSEQTKATWELLNGFAVEYERRKEHVGIKSFRDVSVLLARGSLRDRLQDLYFRLDCTLKHALFDEFQDTSRADWQVIEPFVSEILSKESGDHSYFCVGDPKQAIYQWRGGVAEIFDSIRQKWPHVQEQSLAQSRRSSPEIINFVNMIFMDLQSNPALRDEKAVREWVERYVEHQTVITELGYVLVQEVDPASGENVAVDHTALCDEVERLLGESPGLEIGVLVRTNNDLVEVIEAFRHRPALASRVSAEGGNPLTDSAAVGVILALLKLLDYPNCSVSRFHVSQSKLGAALGLTDLRPCQQGRMVLAKLRDVFEKQGLVGLIEHLCSFMLPQSGGKDSERMRQLLDLTLRTPREMVARPSEFIDIVEGTRIEGATRAAVRVMTIHQSKGLEFDVIFLPSLEDKLMKMGRDPLLVYHDNMAAAPMRVARYVGEGVRMISPELGQAYEQVRAEYIKEALSVLYVSLTRARRALYLYVARSKEGVFPLSMAGVVRGALTGRAADSRSGVLFENGSSRWWAAEGLSGGASDLETEPVTGKLDFSSVNGERRRTFVCASPSAFQDAQERSVQDVLRLGQDIACRRGRALHRLFEEVSWIEDGLPDGESLMRLLESELVEESDREGVLAIFSRAMSNVNIRKVFSLKQNREEGVEMKLLREYPFAVLSEGIVLRGIFDRLVTGREAGVVKWARIVDFKTGLTRPYRAQMAAYRRALSLIYPAASLLVQAIFVEGGEVINY